MIMPEHAEVVDDFAAFGITAFTTTRAFGSLRHAAEAEESVSRRWDAIWNVARTAGVTRFATSDQVHGARVLVHDQPWDGWCRAGEADGHFAANLAVALAVTIADCVPVFFVHPAGAVALVHAGWRGTAARVDEAGIAAFTARGLRAADLRMHLGPAICGRCYEVSADVAERLTGRAPPGACAVDLRAMIADRARAAGVRHITTSARCTKCDNVRFFSHRAGDQGRQAAVIVAGAQ